MRARPEWLDQGWGLVGYNIGALNPPPNLPLKGGGAELSMRRVGAKRLEC